MNSSIPTKRLTHGLILISAALLINANAALAADRAGDAQTQARDLLAGTVGGMGSAHTPVRLSGIQEIEK